MFDNGIIRTIDRYHKKFTFYWRYIETRRLFEQVKPDTLLVQADFKIRNICPVKSDSLTYQTHGKSSYTLVLEWAQQEQIDTLFYITDVTGFFYEEMDNINFELFWLVPTDFVPRVPFGKAIKVA